MGNRTFIKKWQIVALLILFIGALAARTFRAQQELVANPDVIRYVEQMHNLPRDPIGTMRAEVYHPLHAAVACLVHAAIGGMFPGGWDDRMGWIWALRIVGIVSGAILAVQIVRLARWFGAPFWAGLGAGAVWIVGRRASMYGADGLSDLLTWALFAEAMLQAMPALRELQRRGQVQRWRWAAVGGLSGLAYLARPEGVAAVVMLTGALAVLAVCRPRGGAKRLVAARRVRQRWFKVLPARPIAAGQAASAVVWLAAGFLLLALPYMAIIGGFTGKKPLIARGWAEATPVLLAGPTGTVLQNIRKVTDELQETFFWAPWLALLLAMPLKPRLWGRPRLRVLALVWIGVWDAVMYWLIGRAGYLDGRHTLPLVILLHVLLALALATWTRPMALWMGHWRQRPERWAALPAWRKWGGWPRVSVLPVLLFAITPGLILMWNEPRDDKAHLLAAARWIGLNARRDVVVCDFRRVVGYYSGHPYAGWHGYEATSDAAAPRLDEIERARRENGEVPALVGKDYAGGEAVRGAMGPYEKVAGFRSPDGKEVYVLYAVPGDGWRK